MHDAHAGELLRYRTKVPGVHRLLQGPRLQHMTTKNSTLEALLLLPSAHMARFDMRGRSVYSASFRSMEPFLPARILCVSAPCFFD